MKSETQLSPTKMAKLRKLSGLLQVEMAEKLGVSPRQYQRFESGETPIKAYMDMTFLHIVRSEGVDESELIKILEHKEGFYEKRAKRVARPAGGRNAGSSKASKSAK